MNKKLKTTVGILTLATTTIALLSGCGGKREEAAENKLTYWMELTSAASSTVSNYGETPLAQELSKRLGVEIEYQHPTQGQAAEKFNIMMASESLPDIIEYNWVNYPGGPGKAIEDKKIIPLNEHIEKSTPRLSEYLKNNEPVEKMVMTDKHEIFGYPFIRGEESLSVSQGMVVRADWLKDLGIAEPETIDDWEKMLTAFKEEKGASSPLDINVYAFQVGAFSGAYGVIKDFYVENGKIKYGPCEEGFKDFIIKMSDWYKKGLVTQDIASLSSKVVDSDLIGGKTGAVHGSLGGGIGKWMAAAPNDEFDLVGVKYPVMNKGELPKFNARQLIVPGSFSAITTSCKDVDLAVKVLSYGYTEEGEALFNFGIEGDSYEMKDGYPKYTEKITNNEEGIAMANMLARYTRAYMSGPFIQDRRYMEQYAGLPQQQAAWDNWSIRDQEEDRVIPHVYYEVGESSDIIKNTTSIVSYVDEQMLRFIMGVEPIENYDNFVNELKKRGVEEVISAKQAAYDRYLER